MANTKVTGDLIASLTIATGNIADNAVTSDKISGITTAHITEGSNLYYTDARADARITAATTSDLSEGTNLYYTDARARGAVSVSGNALSYNSSTGVITSNFEESPTFTGDVTVNGFFTSQGIDDNATTTAITINGNREVGIGTTSPFYKLDVNGTFRASGNATFAGTITSGTLSVGTSGTSRFTDTNAYPLQLNRGLAVDVVGAAGTILGLGAYSTGTTYIDAVRITGVLEANGTDGDMQLQVLNSGTHTTALTLNNDTNATFAGSVGIGVTGTPSTKLHLGGTAPGDSIIRQDSTASGTNWEIGERLAGKWQIWEDDTDSVVATFMSSGNVGIGTTSPTSTLDVRGSGEWYDAGIIVRRDAAPTQFGAISQYNGSLNLISVVGGGGGNGEIMFSNHNAATGTPTERLRIDSSGNSTFKGNVTISQPTNGAEAKLTLTSKSAAGNSRTGIIEYDADVEKIFFINEGTTVAAMTSAGNVGIGTDSPNSKLQVTTTGYDTGTTGFRLTHAEETNYVGYARLQTPSGDPIFSLGTIDGATTYETLSMKNGNVGIGAASPIGNLNINGGTGDTTAQDTTLSLTRTSSTSNVLAAKLVLTAPSTYQQNLVFRIKTTASSAENPSYYSDVMTLNYAGNVGIGNTGPQYKLDVLGTSNQQDVLKLQTAWSVVGDYVGMGIGDGWIRNYVENASKDYRAFAFAPRGTERMRIEAGGNVGIGTTSPTRTLDVNGEITHEGLVPKAGAFVDGLVTINKTVSTSANTWTSLDISLGDIGGTGTFVVQVYSDAHGTTYGAWYTVYWSGIMSWYHTTTNDDDIDEIPLHMAGHARNNNTLELRTKLHINDGTSYANRCELQIKTANALSSAPISFRFRKLL